VALPIDISLFVVREILRGLDYAHRAIVHTEDGEERRGIVHRDVSPSNVLVSLDGEVKICDFGIARAHDEERDAAWSEAMVEGKAGYMSPEQANGQPLDPRADVFAAGIILWELLAGRRLYRSEGEEPLLAVAQRAMVTDLPSRDLPFEDELHAIVGRALAKERNERFGSAAEMAAAIEDYASRADLRATARTLRRFIAANFADAVLAARRRRELATRAIARGPLAVFEVLDVPVVGMVPLAPDSVDALDPPSSLAPLTQRDIIFSKSALVLLAISAVLVAYLVFRAVHSG
jgi:serine/threonine-protein kinase